jgi:hypothetical protein
MPRDFIKAVLRTMSHISVSYTENLPDGAARTKPWILHVVNISIYFLREKIICAKRSSGKEILRLRMAPQ